MESHKSNITEIETNIIESKSFILINSHRAETETQHNHILQIHYLDFGPLFLNFKPTK